jgi:hypothetical protein
MKFFFICLLQLYQDIKPCPLHVLMHVGWNCNIMRLSIIRSRSSVGELSGSMYEIVGQLHIVYQA